MAVFYKQGLRERINLCLFSLSLADELYLVHCAIFNSDEISRQYGGESVRPSTVYQHYTDWNLHGFYGLIAVSYVISTLIACERCFCVVSPLRSQAVLTTRTMAVVLAIVFVVVTGGFFVVATRLRVGCVFDLSTGALFYTFQDSDFYFRNKDLVDYLDSVAYGAVLTLLTTVLVTLATAVTGFKLRQAAVWRSEASSATPSLSSRQVALTRMLIGNAILFVVCLLPNCFNRLYLFFEPELKLGRRQQNLFLVLVWLSEVLSYVNISFGIVIYYVMGSRYRQTLHVILRALTCRSTTAAVPFRSDDNKVSTDPAHF